MNFRGNQRDRGINVEDYFCFTLTLSFAQFMSFLYSLLILAVSSPMGRRRSIGFFVQVFRNLINHANNRAMIRISNNSTLNAMSGCRSMSRMSR